VAQHNGGLEFVYRSAIKGFAAELSDAAVAALRTHPEIVQIEQDG
jgi:hypothetical protein